MTIVADGSAFGSQMGRVSLLMKRKDGICLYLPESFEWIILSSGILSGGDLADMLRDPGAYIESSEYFSWERFFTDVLMRRTRGTWLQYSKSRLNPVYLQGKCKERILAAIPDAVRRLLKEA